MSSIRKSIRKKTKSKESHHEIALSKKGKENKLEKVVNNIGGASRGNWAESLQSLNSSKLEEEFLPDVVEQKKQQKKLHSDSSITSMPPNVVLEGAKKRKRAHSTPSSSLNEPSSKKPPNPVKKSKPVSINLSEELPIAAPVAEEEKVVASADKLFAWIISPVKTEQFFA